MNVKEKTKITFNRELKGDSVIQHIVILITMRPKNQKPKKRPKIQTP